MYIFCRNVAVFYWKSSGRSKHNNSNRSAISHINRMVAEDGSGSPRLVTCADIWMVTVSQPCQLLDESRCPKVPIWWQRRVSIAGNRTFYYYFFFVLRKKTCFWFVSRNGCTEYSICGGCQLKHPYFFSRFLRNSVHLCHGLACKGRKSYIQKERKNDLKSRLLSLDLVLWNILIQLKIFNLFRSIFLSWII